MSGTRLSAFLKLSKRDLKYDFPASIVVFLVALPLCLGIAMASGAPLFAGLLTGVIGGLVVASISKSPLSVSGPAAGLTVIVLGAIEQLGAYETFLLAVVIAGIVQLILGILKAGMIGNYFPSAVILGMLAAIGITIILKQIPLAFGLTEEHAFELDGGGGIAAFSDTIFASVNWGATIICLLSLAVLIYWPKIKGINKVPAPLIVVLLGVGLATVFQGSTMQLNTNHFVVIPIVSSFQEFTQLFIFPDFTQIVNKDVWIVAFTIAIIASLETLLSIEAIDKIDPFKRVTPTNRELVAQGVGNMTSGFLGGLPLTSVIVRSSANAQAGGRTRQSAMLHGIWLLVALLAIPSLINLIPLSCLAAILLHTGYKLANPSLFKKMLRKGLDQFIPFFATIVAVVFTDLLMGVGIGIVVALFYIIRANMQNAFKMEIDEENGEKKVTMTLAEEVSFLNKVPIQQKLYSLPKGVQAIRIDGRSSKFIDKDVIEVLKDFQTNAISKGIDIELESVTYKKNKKAVTPHKEVNVQ
ncbi:SulP family inorganic anion transporter [Sphingobacterium corticibacterium]|uniref:SulP family inorganic anion transporter n=1 Tax=Sphingobacterium corticibacterium TaxID=2484746 RepID=A0A4Q6XF54_9SPHI|nr:SulP family inorganic anion transporter [Sphingobacterium corticibacterium]RZF58471.1 SulP family inorganic anion transporter [Sphingobacterium corticibacterium]